MTQHQFDAMVCTHQHLQRLTGLQTFACMDCGKQLNADNANAAELVALRTWKAKAEPLLRSLAQEAMEYGEDQPWCMYCIRGESEGHATNCPVTLARALLAESEASHG